MNGLLRLSIGRDGPFGVQVQQTSTEPMVQGFGDTLDDAMKTAAHVLERWFGLTRKDAYSFMSVAVDFPRRPGVAA